jgi:hypothetical protein
MLQIYHVSGRAITGWYNSTNSTGVNRVSVTFRGSTYATNQSDWDAVWISSVVFIHIGNVLAHPSACVCMHIWIMIVESCICREFQHW